MERPIYPKIIIRDGVIKSSDETYHYLIRIGTDVRKEHEGVYYLIPVIQQFEYKLADPYDKVTKSEKMIESLKNFYETCYRNLIMFYIDPDRKLTTLNGLLIDAIKDVNQDTETKRLLKV